MTREQRFNELLQQASAGTFEEHNAWYRDPNLTERDSQVMEMIRIYQDSSPEERLRLQGLIRKYEQVNLFGDFGGRMTDRAEKEESPFLLGQALLALVVQGFRERESLMLLRDICDVARWIGVRREKLLGMVRAYAEGRALELIEHAAEQQVPL